MDAITSNSIWLNAFAATAAISFVPNVILFVIPTSLLTKGSSNGIHFQHILLCFAAGALLGDVLIHSIPHLLTGDHDHDHHDHHDHDHSEHKEEEHDHFKMIYIGVLILSGFLIFFIAEKVATRHFHNADDEKLHDTDAKKEKKEIIIQDKAAQSELRRRNVGNNSNQTDSNSKDDAGDELNITGKEKLASCPRALYLPSFSRLTASGWLNLLADSMHNFTDGIALGATFSNPSKSNHLGIAAMLSIMFHEIPHELGDFSILIESGFSKWEAIQAQFITAIAAFLGTFVGLYAHKNEFLETIMIAVTSGGFLYIATVTIMPLVIAQKSSLIQTFLESVAFLIGVGFMVAVAVLEEIHE